MWEVAARSKRSEKTLPSMGVRGAVDPNSTLSLESVKVTTNLLLTSITTSTFRSGSVICVYSYGHVHRQGMRLSLCSETLLRTIQRHSKKVWQSARYSLRCFHMSEALHTRQVDELTFGMYCCPHCSFTRAGVIDYCHLKVPKVRGERVPFARLYRLTHSPPPDLH